MINYWKTGFHLFLYELITSNQLAAVVLRKILKRFALNLCILVLLCEIILHIPLAYDIPSVPKPDTSDPAVHVAFILGSSGALLLAGAFHILVKTVYFNIQRQNIFFDKKFFEEATFLAENIQLKKTDMENDLKYYPVNLKLEDVKN